MALKLLNPGLRPLGTFDLEDDNLGTGAAGLVGGEHVAMSASDTPGTEGYAADVGNVGPMGLGTVGGGLGAPIALSFRPDTRTEGTLGGLADEGVNEYGTLFGQLIGSNAGRATVEDGAVVIGPNTNAGSGKVTVWATAGLYGVSGAAADDGTDGTGTNALSGGLAVNAPVHAHASGDNFAGNLLDNSDAGGDSVDQLAIYVGAVADPSLVSTTNAAAGATATVDHFAIFYLGNAAASS